MQEHFFFIFVLRKESGRLAFFGFKLMGIVGREESCDDPNIYATLFQKYI